MKFVLFHGSFGNPEENWLPWLKRELESMGQEVVVPQFPVDDWEELTKLGESYISSKQTLDNWLNAFEPIAKSFKESDKLCFVGHSIACVFILHIVLKWKIKLNCAIFAAPFYEDLKGKWQFYCVNKTFYKDDFDFLKLKKLIPTSFVLYGDNDPYVEEKFPLEFALKLGSEVQVIKNGGHLNAGVGFLEFPQVLELCKARI